MEIHKWLKCDFEEWGLSIKIRLYLNPFAFFIELELLCFSSGLFIYK